MKRLDILYYFLFSVSLAGFVIALIAGSIWISTDEVNFIKRDKAAKATSIGALIGLVSSIIGFYILFKRRGNLRDININTLSGDQATTLTELGKLAASKNIDKIKQKIIDEQKIM